MNAPYAAQQFQQQPLHPQQQPSYPSQQPVPPPSSGQQPQKGTLFPGQQISVGKVKVVVEKYLSEGGFAHVYLVRTQEPINGTDRHVLKRVAVREKSLLDEVRREVEVMKLLRGHPNIVNLIDADAFKLPDGTHEVLILMEFASGGGIIDMMNRRLRERLTEKEILQVFVDVCEGVAKMHSLSPPLIHRDLKVENILQSGTSLFKLCDFGSVATSRPPPSTVAEMREVELEINTHTTMQYRAPEMVDVYQRRVIDEKSDIWALGVLLYKLCYYTTPFEEHGPLAILNVQYRVPPFPVYSNRINLLIGSMLQEHGHQRPSAVQILTTVHSMRGTKSPFRYNEPKSTQPSNPNSQNLFDIISSVPTPVAPAPMLNVIPMRRGRPTKGAGGVEEQSAPPPPVSATVVPVGGAKGKAQFNLTGERVPPPQTQPQPLNGAGSDHGPLKPLISLDFNPRAGAATSTSSSSGGGFATNFAPSSSSKPFVTSPLPFKATHSAPTARASFSSTLPSSSYDPSRRFQPNPSFSQSSATPLFRPSSSSLMNDLNPPLSNSPQPISPSVPFDGFSDLLEPVRPVSTATSAKSSSKWPPASDASKTGAGASSPASWSSSFSSGFGDSFAPSSSKPSSPLPVPVPSSASTSKPELAREPSFDDRFPSFEKFDSSSPSNSVPPAPSLGDRRYTRSPSPPRPAKAPSPIPPTFSTKQSFVHHVTGPSSSPKSATFPSSHKPDLSFQSRSTHVTGAAMDDAKPARGAKELLPAAGGALEGWIQLEGADGAGKTEEKKVREDWLTGDDGYSALQDPKTIHKAMSPSPLLSGANLSKGNPPVIAPKPSLDLSSTSKLKSGAGTASEPSSSPIASSLSASDRKPPPRGKTLPPPAITAPKPISFVSTTLTSTAKPVRPRLDEPVASSSSILSDQWSPLEDVRAKLKDAAPAVKPKPVTSREPSSSGDEDEAPEDPMGGVGGRGGAAGRTWKPTPKPSIPLTNTESGVEVGGLSAKAVDEFGSKRFGSATTTKTPNPRIGGPRTQPSSSQPPPTSLYNAPPRLTTVRSSSSSTSNDPRRLPTIDLESASTFIRGPGAASRKARPQSLYAPSPTTPTTDSLRSSAFPALSSKPSSAAIEASAPPTRAIKPPHRRSTSISDRASAFEAPPSASLSTTSSGRPVLNTKVPGLAGARDKGLKTVTAVEEEEEPRLVGPTATKEKEGEKGEEQARPSVSSLISRWQSKGR